MAVDMIHYRYINIPYVQHVFVDIFYESRYAPFTFLFM